MSNSNLKAIKSGILYSLSSILSSVLLFISTPYFTRVMSQWSYGAFNNYLSWYGILSAFSLNLGASIISAKRDYKDNIQNYISSICVLNFIIIFALWILYFVLSMVIGCNIIDNIYMIVLFANIAFNQAFTIFQIYERFSFRWRTAILLNLFNSLLSVILPMILLSVINDQMAARTFGHVIPQIIVGILCLYIVFRKSLIIRTEYWKYALPICVPFVPHLLSLTMLNSLDKIMITDIIGEVETAVYSVAYLGGAAVSLIVGVFNNAFGPWLIDNLEQNRKEIVRKISCYYILGFYCFVYLFLLLGPEFILIIAGEEYFSSVEILPPIIVGCSMQLVYTMYVNIEQYYKATASMALLSVLSAILNFILNYLFIPEYGFEIAAYTTLISYSFLALGHIAIVEKLNYGYLFNRKISIMTIIINLFLVFFFNYIYAYRLVRFSMLFCCFCFLVVFFYKHQEFLKKIILRLKLG